jgi:hypothetical protein
MLNNGDFGIRAGGGASVALHGEAPWYRDQPVVISGNVGGGITLDRSYLGAVNGIVIENNEGPALLSHGGDITFGAYLTESVIRGNGGGAWLDEETSAGFWGRTLFQENGAFGVRAESGSHVTFFGGEDTPGDWVVLIEGHTEVGVSVTSNSQASFHGLNRVRANGSLTNPSSAAVLVDGNSQAFFGPDGYWAAPGSTEITGNLGAGIAVDMNSSIEVVDAAINGNAREGIRVLHMSAARIGSGADVLTNDGGALMCDKSSLVLTALVKKSSQCRNVELP